MWILFACLSIDGFVSQDALSWERVILHPELTDIIFSYMLKFVFYAMKYRMHGNLHLFKTTKSTKAPTMSYQLVDHGGKEEEVHHVFYDRHQFEDHGDLTLNSDDEQTVADFYHVHGIISPTRAKCGSSYVMANIFMPNVATIEDGQTSIYETRSGSWRFPKQVIEIPYSQLRVTFHVIDNYAKIMAISDKIDIERRMFSKKMNACITAYMKSKKFDLDAKQAWHTFNGLSGIQFAINNTVWRVNLISCGKTTKYYYKSLPDYPPGYSLLYVDVKRWYAERVVGSIDVADDFDAWVKFHNRNDGTPRYWDEKRKKVLTTYPSAIAAWQSEQSRFCQTMLSKKYCPPTVDVRFDVDPLSGYAGKVNVMLFTGDKISRLENDKAEHSARYSKGVLWGLLDETSKDFSDGPSDKSSDGLSDDSQDTDIHEDSSLDADVSSDEAPKKKQKKS
jgi:hypothetical protein